MVYTVSECWEVINSVDDALESLKHLLTTTKDNSDNKLVTPELLDAYEHLAGICADYIDSYNFYNKAKFWECANLEEYDAKSDALLEARIRQKAQKAQK